VKSTLTSVSSRAVMEMVDLPTAMRASTAARKRKHPTSGNTHAMPYSGEKATIATCTDLVWPSKKLLVT